MAIFKRNIWTMYLTLMVGGVVLLGALLNSQWQTVLDEHKANQKSRAELIAQSIDGVLLSRELVLDVIGRELISQEVVFSASEALPLLDSVLQADPALVGFGLARPDGTLVRVSSNLDVSRLPNLLEHPETRASFLAALDSDTLVVGRTYFVEAMDAWAIPIRKALRSPSGDVIAVMTAGLRLGSGTTVFDQSLHEGPLDDVMLFRESDGYVQFMSSEGAAPETYSKIVVPAERQRENRARISSQLGMTLEEVQASSEAVVFRNTRSGTGMLTATLFNQRYQLWVVSETEMSAVYSAYLGSLWGYLAVFFAAACGLFFFFHVLDRSERKRHDELFYQSRHDDLTGLLNRTSLIDRIDALVADRKSFCVVIVNIDNFNGINDRFGQESGDQALIEFANRLRALVEPGDDLVRLGGDEFVILTPDTDLAAVENACVGFANRMSDTIEVGRLQLQVTVSVGVACYPDHGDSFSKLIRSAHLALYAAKKDQNEVCIYRHEMEELHLRRLSVEQRLRYGLAAESLYMVYQPQVNSDGETLGLEALVRWQDDELGFVSPAEFVEVAETSGLMIALGRFVLETSIRDFSSFKDKVTADISLAINISVIQFLHADFADSVLQLLAQYQVSPRKLVLEITESLFMSNFDQVFRVLDRLRTEGIRISMDDFGTGYSSLSLLRRLPIDELKVDKSFVDDVLDDEKTINMVESIVAIAKSYDMELIAEGVESAEQAEALTRLGCSRFQGYHFGRPAPLEEIHERLEAIRPQR